MRMRIAQARVGMGQEIGIAGISAERQVRPASA
jgi:hypothetical protein